MEKSSQEGKGEVKGEMEIDVDLEKELGETKGQSRRKQKMMRGRGKVDAVRKMPHVTSALGS